MCYSVLAMIPQLTSEQSAVASGAQGEGNAMAMRIVAETARLMQAPRLIPIRSAHIDGALYHGDSGTLFAERLVAGGAKVGVRATLNVGSIDLTGCSKNRMPTQEREMARRMLKGSMSDLDPRARRLRQGPYPEAGQGGEIGRAHV